MPSATQQPDVNFLNSLGYSTISDYLSCYDTVSTSNTYNFSCINSFSYNLRNSITMKSEQDGSLTFSDDSDWFFKIKNKKILFNPNFTTEQTCKKFLQTLSLLTHKEGLQYTFDFGENGND